MTYALLDASGAILEYPIYQGDIQLRFPNVSFTNPFEPPAGYVEVVDVPPPIVDHTKAVNLGTPELIDGIWYQTWVIRNLTPEELEKQTEVQAEGVRMERNRRLAESDWTQLPDAPVDHVAWATYRQELRDVTAQPGFPWNVVWPEKP